jgi:hypothetical protein
LVDSLNLELVGAEKLIVLWLVEVDDVDSLTFPAFAVDPALPKSVEPSSPKPVDSLPSGWRFAVELSL